VVVVICWMSDERGESAVLTCQASGWVVVIVETTNERGERQIDVPGEWMGGWRRRNGR